MASSRVETQVTWSGGSSSVTVSSSTPVASDAMAFNAEDWEVDVQVNADNAGTPASGDVCDVQVAYSSGDVLGDSGDDYDSTEHADALGRLDTYGSNTPGEDPARATYRLRTASKGFKLIVTCPQAGSRNIVVRARFIAHRPQ